MIPIIINNSIGNLLYSYVNRFEWPTAQTRERLFRDSAITRAPEKIMTQQWLLYTYICDPTPPVYSEESTRMMILMPYRQTSSACFETRASCVHQKKIITHDDGCIHYAYMRDPTPPVDRRMRHIISPQKTTEMRTNRRGICSHHRRFRQLRGRKSRHMTLRSLDTTAYTALVLVINFTEAAQHAKMRVHTSKGRTAGHEHDSPTAGQNNQTTESQRASSQWGRGGVWYAYASRIHTT